MSSNNQHEKDRKSSDRRSHQQCQSQQSPRTSLLDEVLKEKILELMQSDEVRPWLQQQQQKLCIKSEQSARHSAEHPSLSHPASEHSQPLPASHQLANTSIYNQEIIDQNFDLMNVDYTGDQPNARSEWELLEHSCDTTSQVSSGELNYNQPSSEVNYNQPIDQQSRFFLEYGLNSEISTNADVDEGVACDRETIRFRNSGEACEADAEGSAGKVEDFLDDVQL